MKKRNAPAARTSGKSPRLSAPLVLAVASGMISVGVVAGYNGLHRESLSHQGHREARVHADRTTPERVCVAFLDAWVRQRFEIALELSTGNARNTVISRMARHEESVPGVIALETDWDVFARDPLSLVVQETHHQSQGVVLIRGVAEGKLMGNAYKRAMELEAVQRQGEWYVDEMRPGEVLTGIPVIRPSYDPAELKMREPPE